MEVAPYTPARQLAKLFGMPEKLLLRRAGWLKDSKEYLLRVDGTVERGMIGASAMLPSGSYRVHAVRQCVIPADAASDIAEQRGIKIRIRNPEPEPPPPPPPPAVSGTGVVAVLAHVDHGKTTLLDALLGSDVAANESGGITQCVRPSLLHLDDLPSWRLGEEGGSGRHPGADLRTSSSSAAAPAASSHYRTVDEADSRCSPRPLSVRKLAFVDTPGHGLFVGMRAAAADSADVALILVALDAGIQPQTREVVRRCAELGQPVVFALTKADLYAQAHTEAVGAPRVRELASELRALLADERQQAEQQRGEDEERQQVEEHARRLLEQMSAQGGDVLQGDLLLPTARGPEAADSADSQPLEAPVLVVSSMQRWGLAELVEMLGQQLAAIGGADGAASPAAELQVPAKSASAPVDAAVALLLETARVEGIGNTLLAVVRSGELRRGMTVVCGSAAGRVGSVGVASGRPTATCHSYTALRTDPEAFVPVERAVAGQPVRISIRWLDQSKTSGSGSFAVGDVLRAWPKADAMALVQYRQMVEALMAARRELALDAEARPKAGKAVGAAAGAAHAGAASEAVAVIEAAAGRGAMLTALDEAEDYDVQDCEYAEYYEIDDESEEEGHFDGSAAVAHAEVVEAAVVEAAMAAAAEAEAALIADPPDTARGCAAVIKTQSAGELQAMLDFLEGRMALTAGGEERLVILSCGVGQVRNDELVMAQDAIRQKVPAAVYALGLNMKKERYQAAKKFGVPIREYSVFHNLLTDLLLAAGLPGPARELAGMADDGSEFGSDIVAVSSADTMEPEMGMARSILRPPNPLRRPSAKPVA